MKPPRLPPALVGILALLLTPLLAWVGVMGLINFVLPVLLNGQPERVQVRFAAAWMVEPGRLEIRGLEVRNQGRRDQWWLSLDTASTRISMRDLLSRRLVVTDLVAHGAQFRYRRRLAEGEVASPFQPPLPGLSNPPDPAPEDLYESGAKWQVVITDARVVGIDEMWIGDLRFAGPSVAIGSCALGGAVVSADLTLAMDRAGIYRGDAPVADAIIGFASFELEEMEKSVGLNQSTFDLVTAHATIDARVQGFDFLDFYLQQATWLRLDGTGHLVFSAALDHGRVTDGGYFRADTKDLKAQFLGYAVTGDAVVTGRVAPVDGVSHSQVSVQYGTFSIAEPEGEALVTGKGFRVGATSPDVRLYEPFDTIDLVIDVPESEIPDFSAFDGHLPGGDAFQLLGGTGTVHGKMNAAIPGEVATGDLHVAVQGVRGRFDGLDVTGDVAVHAHLEEGLLAERTYDFAGSRLDVRRFTLSDPELLVGARPWSATVRAREGTAKVGADVWLTADLSLESTDSMPFVILFTRKKPMAPWVRELLAVRDVSGSARVAFGDDLIRITDLDIEGRQFEVKLGWERRGDVNQASLFARYGMFSIGMGVDGADRTIHLFGAREWYGERTGDLPPVVAPVEEAAAPTRKERREERRQEKAEADAAP